MRRRLLQNDQKAVAPASPPVEPHEGDENQQKSPTTLSPTSPAQDPYQGGKMTGDP